VRKQIHILAFQAKKNKKTATKKSVLNVVL